MAEGGDLYVVTIWFFSFYRQDRRSNWAHNKNIENQMVIYSNKILVLIQSLIGNFKIIKYYL